MPEEASALAQYTAVLLPAIEEGLHAAIAAHLPEAEGELLHMLAYHLGWEGEGAGKDAQGKRIRPLLLLLSAAAVGGDWRACLPAAAAVELVHNFSLIHDDIQDHSRLRRGRPTLWVRWGVPQAINTGDLMFTLAHFSMFDLLPSTSPERILAAEQTLLRACVHLTRGQHLDLAFEQREAVTLEEYWDMIAGKTAALLAACAEIGALLAGCDADLRGAFRTFGHNLGLAFQVQDDLLGIWGDAALMGKSSQSDLVAGKKSLPVVYALNRAGEFARRWQSGRVRSEDVSALAQLLKAEGAYDYAQEAARRLTRSSLQALDSLPSPSPAADALRDLASRLLSRQT
jgi:geranylgeranyl diphosphate synthase type I